VLLAILLNIDWVSFDALHDLCKGAQTKRIFYSLISEGCENENKKVNTN